MCALPTVPRALANSGWSEYNSHMNNLPSTEMEIRLAAFRWLDERSRFNDGIFDGSELARGFEYQGRRITLHGQTGIWFPAGSLIPSSSMPRTSSPTARKRVFLSFQMDFLCAKSIMLPLTGILLALTLITIST
jgi:hypothetical protein